MSNFLFLFFLLPFLCGQFIDGMLCKNFMSIQIGNAHRGNSSFCLANLFTNGRHRNAKAFPRGLLQFFFTTNYRFKDAGNMVCLMTHTPLLFYCVPHSLNSVSCSNNLCNISTVGRTTVDNL
uniref:Putative secreted protein n=1 Tax=Ixodes ricinus TaxID=34613 RepID=A0A6B0UPI4_IXORI